MKKLTEVSKHIILSPLTAAFVLLMIMAVSQLAVADQRFESWQGLCHFAYDANDDDNEVYFANCKNSINTYDAGDGQGRLAYGSSKVSVVYGPADKTIIKTLHQTGVINIKGADALGLLYPDILYTRAANTPCVMVTSNYNADADDNNETVYVTNDYNLEITLRDDLESDVVEFVDEDGITRKRYSKSVTVTYELACRGGIAQ